MTKPYYAGPANDVDEYLIYDGEGNVFAKFWHTDPFSAEDCARMTVTAINCHSDLLAALEACDKAFVAWQLGQIPGRPEDILALIAQTRAAIAKAKP